jgi:hypothetical protein
LRAPATTDFHLQDLPQPERPRHVVKIRGRQGTSLEWGNPLGKSLGRLIDMETELLRSKPFVALCRHGYRSLQPLIYVNRLTFQGLYM